MDDNELGKVRDRWHDEVCNRENEIDPVGDYVWEGLLLAFLLGAGVPLEQAQDITSKAPHNGWEV